VFRELKIFWAALKTTPRAVNWFGAGSALILLVKTLWLNSVPAPLPILVPLSEVMKDFLAATFAGWIFFVVSFQLPQVIERRRLLKVVGRLLDLTANGVVGFLQMLSNELRRGDVEVGEVTHEKVKELFTQVSPTAVAPMYRDYYSTRVNWLSALTIFDDQCQAYIAKLWRYARFLDADLVALLDNIEFSAHAAGMRSARELQLRDPSILTNPNLTAWTDNYFEAYEFARQLMRYTTEYRELYAS
jgi:hypothetical protein